MAAENKHSNTALFAVLLLLIGLMLAIFYIDKNQRAERKMQQLHIQVDNIQQAIINDLAQSFSDVFFLSQQNLLKTFIASPSTQNFNTLSQEYQTFSTYHPGYLQIRVLDLKGQEIVRVDRKSNRLEIVSPQNLQDKSQRYYFKQARALKSGEVYQSPLDLNIENGEIQQPWQPTLRFATPISDNQGISAYLIVNINAQYLLNRIDDLVSQSNTKFFILNNSGYYLYANHPAELWGFMFNKPETNLQATQPDLWNKLTKLSTNNSFTHNELFYVSSKICGANQCNNDNHAAYLPSNAVDLPWYIVGYRDTHELSANNWWQNYWPHLIATLLSIVGIYIFTTGHRLSKSLSHLSQKSRELKNSNSRFEKLIDAIPDGLLVVNNQGIIETANKMAENIFGLNSDQLINHPVEILMPEDFKQRHVHLRHSFQKNPHRIHVTRNAPFEYKHPDGSHRLLEIIIDPANFDEQIKAIALVHDVTTRTSIEAQLRQSQKLEAIGQLSGGIAHDFNNLLGIILGNIELIELSLDPESKAYGQLSKAKKASLSAADLTQKLLSISRKKSLATENVALKPLLTDIIDMLQHSIKQKIQIELHLADNLPLVKIDPNELTNALINLAVNARDAMPDGGHILINATPVFLDENYTSSQTEKFAAGDYVLIDITDNGTGIDKQNLEKVLEPFFTTKEKGKGTGLGLSMIYGFIKQSNGHMRIYSERDKGTSIHLYLPVSDNQDLTTKNPKTTFDIPNGKGMKALVIDDEDDLREIAITLLDDMGFTCDTSKSAVNAWEMILDNHYDLIVSDIIMPGEFDGFDLYHKVKAEKPEIKYVLTSGFSEQMVKERDQIFNHAVFLHKPYQIQSFYKAIHQALNDITRTNR